MTSLRRQNGIMNARPCQTSLSFTDPVTIHCLRFRASSGKVPLTVSHSFPSIGECISRRNKAGLRVAPIVLGRRTPQRRARIIVGPSDAFGGLATIEPADFSAFMPRRIHNLWIRTSCHNYLLPGTRSNIYGRIVCKESPATKRTPSATIASPGDKDREVITANRGWFPATESGLAWGCRVKHRNNAVRLNPFSFSPS